MCRSVSDGTQTVNALGADLYTGEYRFEATLSELAPGTYYVYRVGREGSWSVTASFNTAGADEQFSFL